MQGKKEVMKEAVLGKRKGRERGDVRPGSGVGRGPSRGRTTQARGILPHEGSDAADTQDEITTRRGKGCGAKDWVISVLTVARH